MTETPAPYGKPDQPDHAALDKEEAEWTTNADQANEIRRLRRENARLAAELERVTGIPRTSFTVLEPPET